MCTLSINNLVNSLKETANGAATVLCGSKLNYLVGAAREFVPNLDLLIGAKDAICGVWSTTKELFKSIEPYHPLAATVMISCKALWKSWMRGSNDKHVKELKLRLRVLKDLDGSMGMDCSRKIAALKSEMRARNDDKIHSLLAVSQLGSLVFPHPGSNVWNSINALSGRLFSLRSHLPTLNFSSKKNQGLMNVGLGAISVAATMISLLKQTEAIDGDNPLCHGIIGASFIGMGIESGIMIKNWIRSRFF